MPRSHRKSSGHRSATRTNRRRFVTQFVGEPSARMVGRETKAISLLVDRRRSTGTLTGPWHPRGRRPAACGPGGRRLGRQRPSGDALEDGERDASSSRSAIATPCTQPATAFQTPAAPSCRSKPPSRNAWTACSWAVASVAGAPGDVRRPRRPRASPSAHGRCSARPSSTAARQRAAAGVVQAAERVEELGELGRGRPEVGADRRRTAPRSSTRSKGPVSSRRTSGGSTPAAQ